MTTNIVACCVGVGTSHMYHDGGWRLIRKVVEYTSCSVPCNGRVYCGKLLFSVKIAARRYSDCFGGTISHLLAFLLRLRLPIVKML